LLGALNGVALVLREIAVKKGFAFLNGKWLGGLLVTAVLTALTIPAMSVIFDHHYYYGEPISMGYAVPWPLVAVGAYLCYRRLWPNMLAIALILMNACVLVLCAIGRLMFDGHRYYYNEELLFLVFALIIIGIVSLTAFGLKKIAKIMAKERTP
jgi:peptidoglycan/LPS O-acetylase OafA/YrhL